MRISKPTVWFYLAVVPAVLCAWRLVWEQTFLSWERGPQMVGFSLMHSVLGILLFAALVAGLIWAAVVLVTTAISPGRRNLTNIAGAVVIGVAAGATFAPYGFWVGLFASRIAHGPHAAEFLVHMAAVGDMFSVRSLLDQGVPINESNSRGIRAIEAAENAKRYEMRDFLVSRGGTDKRF